MSDDLQEAEFLSIPDGGAAPTFYAVLIGPTVEWLVAWRKIGIL